MVGLSSKHSESVIIGALICVVAGPSVDSVRHRPYCPAASHAVQRHSDIAEMRQSIFGRARDDKPN